MRGLRGILSILGVALLPAFAAAAPRVFVVNSNDADISVIDLATHQVVKTIPLLREPHHLVLSPDHKSLVVGDTRGNSLFFLDPRTGALQRRVTVSDPYQLQYSPNGKMLTTAGLARNQIDIYDAGTLALLHRVPARTMPSHIAYSPDSEIVFVSLQGTDRLIAIRTATGAVAWNQHVCSTPAGVLWLNDHVLVGCMGEAHIAVVDPATGRVVQTIATGKGAHTMFLSPDKKWLYATNRVAGTISVIDPETLQVKRTLDVPGGPDDLEFAPDGKIWAALRFAQSVGVIDPETGAVERITVGRSPHGIWMNTHDGLNP
ncbi:MAG TPA: PQQ-binding-like beta-propeller repeat protein [Rhizomicrobium sp.]|nr:PQQ-binding-like beta-propeller repeat protein [Rhizomicrobium sp.]